MPSTTTFLARGWCNVAVVNVPGVGRVNFPDDMTPEQDERLKAIGNQTSATYVAVENEVKPKLGTIEQRLERVEVRQQKIYAIFGWEDPTTDGLA